MDQKQEQASGNGSLSSGGEQGSGVSSGATATAVQDRPKTSNPPPRVDRMPPWNVLLHNDDVNEMGFVVETIVALVHLNPRQALLRMIEAHKSGIALLVTTHRERAELLCEQFASKGLVATIEPA